MNSRIREIVRKHVGASEALIAELEAYHERAMIEAADGALMGRAMLDRAIGRYGADGYGSDSIPTYKMSPERPGQEHGDESMNDIMRAAAFERDLSLDVRPGARSPGEAVRDYVAGVVDDLRVRRDELAFRGFPPDWKWTDVEADMNASKLDDIIERNAPAWQDGETDDERARR